MFRHTHVTSSCMIFRLCNPWRNIAKYYPLGNLGLVHCVVPHDGGFNILRQSGIASSHISTIHLMVISPLNHTPIERNALCQQTKEFEAHPAPSKSSIHGKLRWPLPPHWKTPGMTKDPQLRRSAPWNPGPKWSLKTMGVPGSWNGGTVPCKAIFCGDIPLYRPYIW